MKQHNYRVALKWTGNKGEGTKNYKAYARMYSVFINNKPELFGSSDPEFLGDKTKYNPEELFVVSISSCHMLWYLHLCSQFGVVVIDYGDEATGTMEEAEDGSGRFTEVRLNPTVIVSEKSMIDTANNLHKKANQMCFIANSLNFKVDHHPVCKTIKTEH
jgi:organic hydroperoxide reductase OsmC/OhrA